MTDHPSRRDALTYIGAVAGLSTIGCGGASSGSPDAGGPDALEPGPCGPRTGSQTEGPFYPGEPDALMDIRGDRQGVELQLEITVIAAGACTPIAGAEVDFWSADGAGDYSGYATFDTEGQDWLRGQQITDQDGIARVRSIVPGSYPGRAVHIHVKVRAPGRNELTTQVYFPDDVTAAVLAQPEYDGASQTVNAADGFYADDTLMAVTGDVDAGYTATATLVV